MPTIHRLPMPGRDTCAGTCETEAGCSCVDTPRHPDCAKGCARSHCNQGRRTCYGKPLPIPPVTRLVMRQPVVAAYVLGALAAGLVLLCVVLGSALAVYGPDLSALLRQFLG